MDNWLTFFRTSAKLHQNLPVFREIVGLCSHLSQQFTFSQFLPSVSHGILWKKLILHKGVWLFLVLFSHGPLWGLCPELIAPKVTEQTCRSTTVGSTHCRFLNGFLLISDYRKSDVSAQFLLLWLPKSVGHFQGFEDRDLMNGSECYETSVSWECLGYGYRIHYCHINRVWLCSVSAAFGLLLVSILNRKTVNFGSLQAWCPWEGEALRCCGSQH